MTKKLEFRLDKDNEKHKVEDIKDLFEFMKKAWERLEPLMLTRIWIQSIKHCEHGDLRYNWDEVYMILGEFTNGEVYVLGYINGHFEGKNVFPS